MTRVQHGTAEKRPWSFAAEANDAWVLQKLSTHSIGARCSARDIEMRVD
jgi:hypothetical protein